MNNDKIIEKLKQWCEKPRELWHPDYGWLDVIPVDDIQLLIKSNGEYEREREF